MTSPLHGEGRRFESGRAHCFSAFFNEIEPEITSAVSYRKLSTPAKVNEFTLTGECAVAISTPVSSSNRPLSCFNTAIETDKHTLGNLALPFTSDELTYYVERRNIGLAGKSWDWTIRATRNFWNTTRGIISRKTLDQFLTRY